MSNTRHTKFWKILEICSDPRKESVRYWADAAGFDAKKLLAESDETLHRLLKDNITYIHIKVSDDGNKFHSIVDHLLENDVDSLVSGIAKRLCGDIHPLSSWTHLATVPSHVKPVITGKVMTEKYGIKITDTPAPVDSDAK